LLVICGSLSSFLVLIAVSFSIMRMTVKGIRLIFSAQRLKIS
jgi:hypothetical protein